MYSVFRKHNQALYVISGEFKTLREAEDYVIDQCMSESVVFKDFKVVKNVGSHEMNYSSAFERWEEKRNAKSSVHREEI